MHKHHVRATYFRCLTTKFFICFIAILILSRDSCGYGCQSNDIGLTLAVNCGMISGMTTNAGRTPDSPSRRGHDEMAVAKPRIVILATGGTIAGKADDVSRSSSYTPGVIRVETLLEAVPLLSGVADITARQVASVGSEDMTDEIWLRLHGVLQALIADPGVDGIVILHGTDTMEETACFLDLTLGTDKPIILTGAMRPANAVSADGPGNLLSSVRLAASSEAVGRGVLVVFNDCIFAARDVVKTDAVNLDAFSSPGFGPLGRMLDAVPLWYRLRGKNVGEVVFPVGGVSGLPRVEIIYGHAGQRPEVVRAALECGAKGIVHAGVGAGNIHAAVKPLLLEAVGRGVPVVAASRCAVGITGFGEAGGVINSCGLNPQKARVVLQLALIGTADSGRIQELFAAYVYAGKEK